MTPNSGIDVGGDPFPQQVAQKWMRAIPSPNSRSVRATAATSRRTSTLLPSPMNESTLVTTLEVTPREAIPDDAMFAWWFAAIESDLNENAAVRRRGKVLMRLPPPLWVPLFRMSVEVDSNSSVDASGTARDTRGALRGLQLALTARGRALLLGHPLAAPTQFVLKVSLATRRGSFTRRSTVTVPA